MKLYKCYVKHTEVREGFLFVEAKSLESAKSLEWVQWALDEMNWDELPTTQDLAAIESAEEVTSASQVPQSQMKEYPWYNPSECHEEDRRISDWVKSMTPVDISKQVEWRIGMRMRELKRIKDDVRRLKRYLKKRKAAK
jgi:pullulanase/glycogen debranching enzyme